MLRPLSGPAPLAGQPTEGPAMVRWIEANCTYGEGDKEGEPVRLELFQKYLCYHAGRLRPDGRWHYKRILFELPKGNGKTPINAWIQLYLLRHRRSPVIPIGATSFGQADLLFGDMTACVEASPKLQRVFEAYEDRIVCKDRAGTAFKVSAKGGTNDGKRPSSYGADEIHELITPEQQKSYRVIARGVVKRQDGLVLCTTTPGSDLESLAGKLHTAGLLTNAGERNGDERMLFVWYGCPDYWIDEPGNRHKFDLEDPDQLRTALRLANPAADLFLDVDEHVALLGTMPRHEYERYHLGRWVQVLGAWLPPGAWDALLDTEAKALREHGQPSIRLGSNIVLGFDGSFSGDSTALVAEDLATRRQMIVGIWERPENAVEGWKVDQDEVEAVIRATFKEYQVRELVYDPRIWHQLFERLEAEGFPVVEMPQGQHMLDAAQRMFEDIAAGVVGGRIHHDGDPRLARHYGNCVSVTVSGGVRVQKERRDSTRYIDLAVASIEAHEHASRILEESGVDLW